jgi:uncharacterized RDD family membrane protein YckC
MIDSSYSVETPEGVELRLRVAGCGVRAGAWLIDTMIHAGIIFVLLIFVGMFSVLSPEFAMASIMLLVFLLNWFYPIFFEVYKNGKTPGKKALGIQAIHNDGTPIGWKSSLIRNFLRSADFLPFFYLSGILSIILDRKCRRLGDLASGTLVVYTDDERQRYKIPKSKALMLPITLEDNEKKAVVAFAERHKLLSQPRQQELAEILKPVHGKEKGKAVKTVQSYAVSLVGDS